MNLDADRLAIARRLRALLPHVTTDPEAEALLDELIGEHADAPHAPVVIERDAAALIGQWGWYETDEAVHGPFSSRESAMEDIQMHAATGRIQDLGYGVYVGQYESLNVLQHVCGSSFAESLIESMADVINDLEVFDHETDSTGIELRVGAEEALTAFVVGWASKYLLFTGQTWRIDGVSCEDEIVFPQED